MRTLILAILLTLCLCDPLITKELIEKVTAEATFEATKYEENVFKGMDTEEIMQEITSWADTEELPPMELKATKNEKAISWEGANCEHEIKNQGECSGASFAIAVAGMISDRCCLKGKDHGWLSSMELVSCSKENYGCAGGWPQWAVKYSVENGLVDEKCYPYSGKMEDCPIKCKNGGDWKSAHVCKCTNPVALVRLDDVKAALADGPVVVTFEAYDDLFTYKSGIYCHTTGKFRKLMSARVLGYSEEGQPHLILAASLGTAFGDQGKVKMCTTCCGLFGKYEKGNVACTPVP